MQGNVQRALGFSPERSAPPEILPRCHRCGEYLEFCTDAIGRSLERCPRCKRSELMGINAAEADAEDALRAARAAMAERPAQPHHLAGRAKSFAPKVCELATCAKPFVPKSGNQRFCTGPCSAKARA